jgi:hypothetical protein
MYVGAYTIIDAMKKEQQQTELQQIENIIRGAPRMSIYSKRNQYVDR